MCCWDVDCCGWVDYVWVLVNLKVIIMKLNLFHDSQKKCFKLVNIDAIDNEKQLNRNIDSWSIEKGTSINMTYWKNDSVNEINSFKYNRVGIHYKSEGRRISKYYFCINDIIEIKELTISQRL
jgi:hypothetical protein